MRGYCAITITGWDMIPCRPLCNWSFSHGVVDDWYLYEFLKYTPN